MSAPLPDPLRVVVVWHGEVIPADRLQEMNDVPLYRLDRATFDANHHYRTGANPLAHWQGFHYGATPDGVEAIAVLDEAGFHVELHERFHTAQNPAFSQMCGFAMNEGFTEYFTRLITVPRGLAHPSQAVSSGWVAVAEDLAVLVGPDLPREAYFGAGPEEVRALARQVDMRTSPGTFVRVRDLVNAGRVADARSLLLPELPATPAPTPALEFDEAGRLAVEYGLDPSGDIAKQLEGLPEEELEILASDLRERHMKRGLDLYGLDVEDRIEISRRTLADASGLPGQQEILVKHDLQNLDLTTPIEEQLPLERMTGAEKQALASNMQKAAAKSIDLRLERGDMVEVPPGGETESLVNEALIRGMRAELEPGQRLTPEYLDVVERLRDRYEGGFDWYRESFHLELEQGVVRIPAFGDPTVSYRPVATAEERALLRKMIGRDTPADRVVVERMMARPEPSRHPEIAELFARRETGEPIQEPEIPERAPELLAKAGTVDVPVASAEPEVGSPERTGPGQTQILEGPERTGPGQTQILEGPERTGPGETQILDVPELPGQGTPETLEVRAEQPAGTTQVAEPFEPPPDRTQTAEPFEPPPDQTQTAEPFEPPPDKPAKAPVGPQSVKEPTASYTPEEIADPALRRPDVPSVPRTPDQPAGPAKPDATQTVEPFEPPPPGADEPGHTMTPEQRHELQVELALEDARDQIDGHRTTLEIMREKGVNVDAIATGHGVDLNHQPSDAEAEAYAERLGAVAEEAIDTGLRDGNIVLLESETGAVVGWNESGQRQVSLQDLPHSDAELIAKAATLQQALEKGDPSVADSEAYKDVKRELGDRLAADEAAAKAGTLEGPRFRDVLERGVTLVEEEGLSKYQPVATPEEIAAVERMAGLKPPEPAPSPGISQPKPGPEIVDLVTKPTEGTPPAKPSATGTPEQGAREQAPAQRTGEPPAGTTQPAEPFEPPPDVTQKAEPFEPPPEPQAGPTKSGPPAAAGGPGPGKAPGQPVETGTPGGGKPGQPPAHPTGTEPPTTTHPGQPPAPPASTQPPTTTRPGQPPTQPVSTQPPTTTRPGEPPSQPIGTKPTEITPARPGDTPGKPVTTGSADVTPAPPAPGKPVTGSPVQPTTPSGSSPEAAPTGATDSATTPPEVRPPEVSLGPETPGPPARPSGLLEPTFGARPGVSGQIPLPETPPPVSVTPPTVDPLASIPDSAPPSVAGEGAGPRPVPLAPPPPVDVRPIGGQPIEIKPIEPPAAPPAAPPATPPGPTGAGGPTKTPTPGGVVEGGGGGQPSAPGTSGGGDPGLGGTTGPRPTQEGTGTPKPATEEGKTPSGQSEGEGQAPSGQTGEPGFTRPEVEAELVHNLEEAGLKDVKIIRDGGEIRVTAIGPDGAHIELKLNPKLSAEESGLAKIARYGSHLATAVHVFMMLYLAWDTISTAMKMANPETTFNVLEKWAAVLFAAAKAIRSGRDATNSDLLVAIIEWQHAMKGIMGPLVGGIPLNPVAMAQMEEFSVLAFAALLVGKGPLAWIFGAADADAMEQFAKTLRAWIKKGKVATGIVKPEKPSKATVDVPDASEIPALAGPPPASKPARTETMSQASIDKTFEGMGLMGIRMFIEYMTKVIEALQRKLWDLGNKLARMREALKKFQQAPAYSGQAEDIALAKAWIAYYENEIANAEILLKEDGMAVATGVQKAAEIEAASPVKQGVQAVGAGAGKASLGSTVGAEIAKSQQPRIVVKPEGNAPSGGQGAATTTGPSQPLFDGLEPSVPAVEDTALPIAPPKKPVATSVVDAHQRLAGMPQPDVYLAPSPATNGHHPSRTPTGGGGPAPSPTPPTPPAPPDLPPIPDVPPGLKPTTTKGKTLVGGAVAVIGLGFGLLGGHVTSGGGTATGQQPTSAVPAVAPLTATPGIVPAVVLPTITAISAQSNSDQTRTDYTATVTGPGPFTFTWGWAVDPGCGSLQTSAHGPTTFSSLTDCPPAKEATAVILACAQGPSGVSEATRSARFGDMNGQTNPLLVEQGLNSDGFTQTDGTGDCNAIVASHGQTKPAAVTSDTSGTSSAGNGPTLAGGIADIGVTGAVGSEVGKSVSGTGLAAGTVLFAGGVITIILKRKPRKPFQNKCPEAPCGGCPRSEHCDYWLTNAKVALENAKKALDEAEAELATANQVAADAEAYWYQVTACINQLEWVIPQLQAYIAAMEGYISALQQAMAMDEQLLSLHGVNAADLSNEHKDGWVEVTPNLYAKDAHTANLARAAGGVDPMAVTLDWAAKNNLLIAGKNSLDDANKNLSDWEIELRDLQEHVKPEADDLLEKAQARLARAEAEEKSAIDVLFNAEIALAAAQAKDDACRAALLVEIKAWASAEAAVQAAEDA